jgi:hypothetical protein
MQIRVSRSGGYAGLAEELGALDTEGVDSARAEAIAGMVHDTGFFELPEALPSEDIGADQFQYAVTVIDGDREHTVSYSDSDEPTTGGFDVSSPRSSVRSLAAAVLHAG